MKRFSRVLIAGLALALVLALAACGASSATPMASSAAMEEMMTTEDAAMQEMAAAPAAPGAENGGGAGQSLSVTADSSRKLIRRIFLDMETKEYDKLSAAIAEQVAATGGYIERSEQSGDLNSLSRYMNVGVRVPKEKADAFLTAIGQYGSVRSRQESSEDVTLNYVDVESHKKSLAIEQERLLALMEKAEKLEDIIALEARLSEVRYELESYESQLRTYDNLIDYTTITLSVYEVERISPVEEKTVWDRISSGFGDTLYRIGIGSQNLFVWFVVNLPYLVVWAIVITVIILAARRLARSGKPIAAKRKAKMPQTPELPEEKTTE